MIHHWNWFNHWKKEIFNIWFYLIFFFFLDLEKKLQSATILFPFHFTPFFFSPFFPASCSTREPKLNWKPCVLFLFFSFSFQLFDSFLFFPFLFPFPFSFPVPFCHFTSFSGFMVSPIFIFSFSYSFYLFPSVFEILFLFHFLFGWEPQTFHRTFPHFLLFLPPFLPLPAFLLLFLFPFPSKPLCCGEYLFTSSLLNISSQSSNPLVEPRLLKHHWFSGWSRRVLSAQTARKASTFILW